MNTDLELSTLVYKLGVNRCYGLLNAHDKNIVIDIKSIDFHFADNGCVHCTLAIQNPDGLRVRVFTKLDCKPEPHHTGPMLNSYSEPPVYIIMEEVTVDGETKRLYDNPAYSDRPRPQANPL